MIIEWFLIGELIGFNVSYINIPMQSKEACLVALSKINGEKACINNRTGEIIK